MYSSRSKTPADLIHPYTPVRSDRLSSPLAPIYSIYSLCPLWGVGPSEQWPLDAGTLPLHPHLYKLTESICDIKMFWLQLLPNFVVLVSSFFLGSRISLSFTFCSRCCEAYLGLWKAFYVCTLSLLLLKNLVQSNQIWENNWCQLYRKRFCSMLLPAFAYLKKITNQKSETYFAGIKIRFSWQCQWWWKQILVAYYNLKFFCPH